MELHVIDIIYATLPMCEQTEKTIFMQRRLYIEEAHMGLDIFRSVSLGDALTIAAVRPFFLLLLLEFLKMFRIIWPSANCKNHFPVTDSQIDLKPACKSNFEFYIFPNSNWDFFGRFQPNPPLWNFSQICLYFAFGIWS